jgi:glyoxylate/hydroxypyruvate reductase A
METEGIFCARTFAMMPRGAMPVNVGRGKHVVDEDLIKALDSGQFSYAALDALWPQPLPSGKPWSRMPFDYAMLVKLYGTPPPKRKRLAATAPRIA